MIITVEGTNGTGKTTLAKSLVEELREAGVNAEYARLPGASDIAVCVAIRAILQEGSFESPYTKFFLYMADMVEWYAHLDPSKVYILDRSYISTYVYQTMDGIPAELIEQVVAKANMKLDACILLQCDPTVAVDRLNARESKTLADYKNRAIEFYAANQNRYADVVTRGMMDEEYVSLSIDTTAKNTQQVLAEAVVYVKELLNEANR